MANSQVSALAAGAAAPAWRQFPFFDVLQVKDAHDLASSPELLKNTLELSVVAPSLGGILVADIHGSISILNREFEPVKNWVAHIGGRVTHMIERKGILVTLGEEDSVRSPLIKIWDLEKIDKKTGAPLLLRSTKVQLSNRPHPVSTLALSATLSHLAIGLGDGTVLLYRNLDQSIFSGSSSLTAIPKPKAIHESPNEPITGLGFKEPVTTTSRNSQSHAQSDDANLHLFVVTTNRVIAYQASGKGAASGSGTGATAVDEIGCSLGCAAIERRRKEIVVARDEAIYICGTEGRGACYAFEGRKSSVHIHLNYLVIVSPPFVPTASAPSATVRNFVARSNSSSEADITKISVFDLENKLVAYSGTFVQGVRAVISQWSRIYILGNDGNLSCLEEKPTSAKLDMLYRKSLFLLALNLAKTQELDESSVADIHKQYGDHLYSKADYDGAMQQFVQTIGHLQPSYVIRKFLDAQRIHNLVTYLQELHSLGLANADHTTLLLNTYTKLKDVTRLDSFIKTESRRAGSRDNGGELPFDLETAIRVCRQAGYFEHASYLANKYQRHEDYLRIQIEDSGNFKEALTYMRKLGPETAESNLARYGRAMLMSLPEETTQLLIDLCTNTGPPTETDASSATRRQGSTGPSYLSYLALNRNTMIAPAILSGDGSTPPSPAKPNKPLEAALPVSSSADGESRSSTPPATSTLDPAKLNRPPKKPSPRLYFANFVDHMDYFKTFLETVAKRRWGQSVDDEGAPSQPSLPPEDPIEKEEDKADQAAVWNTLLELYLTLSGNGDDAKKKLRAKALRLLKNDAIPYDPTHALILCSSFGFTSGLVLLWERMGLYEEVLRYWMDRDEEGSDPNASAQVVSHLNAYGPKHPHLYPLVLRFLTSSPELLSRHTKEVKDVLEHIDQEKILSPLGVIQVLSRNEVASVGLVKEWLIMRIKEANGEILTDQQLTNSYRLETAKKLKTVEELSDPEQPRVFHVTRCSSCGGQLDLPSIHFMCNHSYHQRCIVDHETECPNCARDHGVIREIRRNNARLADQHDLFLSEVSEQGFAAVATAFGRGVLNMSRLEEVGS